MFLFPFPCNNLYNLQYVNQLCSLFKRFSLKKVTALRTNKILNWIKKISVLFFCYSGSRDGKADSADKRQASNLLTDMWVNFWKQFSDQRYPIKSLTKVN